MFNKTWRSFVLVAGETVLLACAVVISSVLVGGAEAWELLADNTAFLRVLLIVVVCQVCLHYTDLYDLRTINTKKDLVTRVIRAIGATSLILGFAYWLFPLLVVQQGVFLMTAVLALVMVMAWRSMFDLVISRLAPRERLLLVGTSPAAIVLARELFERRQELGVDIVGFVDPDPTRVGAPVINPGVVGTIDDIPGPDRADAGRSRGGQPVGSARQAADGSAARRAPAERRAVRSPGDGLRGIHRQDRAREPASELAGVLDRLPQDAAADDHQARVRPGRRGLRLDPVAAADADHGAASSSSTRRATRSSITRSASA